MSKYLTIKNVCFVSSILIPLLVLISTGAQAVPPSNVALSKTYIYEDGGPV